MNNLLNEKPKKVLILSVVSLVLMLDLYYRDFVLITKLLLAGAYFFIVFSVYSKPIREILIVVLSTLFIVFLSTILSSALEHKAPSVTTVVMPLSLAQYYLVSSIISKKYNDEYRKLTSLLSSLFYISLTITGISFLSNIWLAYINLIITTLLTVLVYKKDWFRTN